MTVKIFYAWQSDRDRAICHDFIKEAAEAAIVRLNADVMVEDALEFPEIVLDHDTKGIPGSPAIAEWIKRKIAEADVFLADMTHVGEFMTHDKRKKKSQNGNVLIELGQALIQKSPERVLMVMNTAFGSFVGLPFDLQSNRKPIAYELANTSNPAQAEKAKTELTDRLAEAFRVMLIDIAMKEHSVRSRDRLVLLESARTMAEAARAHFERRIREKQFPHFNGDRAICTLVTIPLELANPPIDLAKHQYTIREKMSPMVGTSFNYHFYSDSFVIARRSGASGSILEWGVSETKSDGCVFAAHVMKPTQTIQGTVKTGMVLHFGPIERRLMRKVADQVIALKGMGVTGPVLVGLSLLYMRGVFLVSSFLDADGSRELGQEDVTAPLVEIAPDVDVDDPQTLALLFKPTLDYVWRSFGYPSDPCFDFQNRFLATSD